MKLLRIILIVSFAFIVALSILNSLPVAPAYKHDNQWRIAAGDRPLIIPHGGAKKLYPENTIYSYEMIDKEGYDVFEIDLCLTADNKLITHHDIDILRTTGYEGKIIDKTYEELKQYNFAQNFINLDGEHPFKDIDDHIDRGFIPATLDYLFEAYPEEFYILEIKDTTDNSGEEVFIHAVDTLIDLIEEHNMNDKVIVASFDDKVIEYFKEATDKKIMTGSGLTKSIIFTVLSTLKVDFFYKPTDAALMLPIKDDIKEPFLNTVKKIPAFLRNKFFSYDEEEDKYYTDVAKKGIIKDAHRHNMAVFFWTVNDKETMRELIEMDVDGIITDRPDLMKELLVEMGYYE